MNKPILSLPADQPKICENCRFAGAHESNDNWRYCRAHSPDFSSANGRAIWPTTTVSDWCGEFKA